MTCTNIWRVKNWYGIISFIRKIVFLNAFYDDIWTLHLHAVCKNWNVFTDDNLIYNWKQISLLRNSFSRGKCDVKIISSNFKLSFDRVFPILIGEWHRIQCLSYLSDIHFGFQKWKRPQAMNWRWKELRERDWSWDHAAITIYQKTNRVIINSIVYLKYSK